MMIQTFEINVAASICPPLSSAEIEAAIWTLMFKKEAERGMGSMMVEVMQTFGNLPTKGY